jgi:tRNA(Ile)-lysidine synthase TilS/MesJ
MRPNVLDRIQRTIDRYAMFRSGMRVGVAVSGGADSVCLLHILLDRDLRLHVLHLNHNLRGGESRTDAEFVRDLAASFRLPCTIREADFSSSHENLEQAAREARLDFFREMREAGVLAGRNNDSVPGYCNVLMFAPPLILTREQADDIAAAVESCLARV